MNKFKQFFDAFGFSGAITFLLALFTLTGITMVAFGMAAGTEIWKTFATALTTFVSSGAVHALDDKTHNTPPDNQNKDTK